MTHMATKDFKYSDSGERAGPSNPDFFLSPRDRKYDNRYRTKDIDNGQKSSSSLYENGTPNGQNSLLSPAPEASKDSEKEYGENGIFSAKRHRLRKLAAHTLFLDAEKPVPKGFNFVSALMKRLFPKNNGENDTDTSEGDAYSSKFLVLHESNNPDKGLDIYHKWDWDMDILNINLGRPTGTITSEYDSFAPHTETQPQDFLYRQPKRRIHRNPNTQLDFSYFLPFERYRQPEYFPLKGLDHWSITDGPRTEPVRPLLQWDFDRTCSPIFNGDPEKKLYLGFSPSWIVDGNRNSDNFVESGSLPNNRLDFEAKFDNVKRAVTEPGQFSLSLPSPPKCITLGEDINAGDILCDQHLLFSCGDHQFFMNKPQRDFWPRDSSALDFYAADNPSNSHAWHVPENESRLCSLSRLVADAVENLSPFSGGVCFYCKFPSSNLQHSLNRLMNRPLLLDQITRDRSGDELFCNDDDDDELKW